MKWKQPGCEESIAQHAGRLLWFLRYLDVDERRTDPDPAASLDVHRTAQTTGINRLASMHAITPEGNKREESKVETDFIDSPCVHEGRPFVPPGLSRFR